MPRCQKCGKELSYSESVCPYCGEPNSGRDEELIKEIELRKEKRKQILAIFVLSMFGIMIVPFPNLTLVLAIISFGLAIPLSIYHTWKKRQAESKLEENGF